jgi:hypothetical protein
MLLLLLLLLLLLPLLLLGPCRSMHGLFPNKAWLHCFINH